MLLPIWSLSKPSDDVKLIFVCGLKKEKEHTASQLLQGFLWNDRPQTLNLLTAAFLLGNFFVCASILSPHPLIKISIRVQRESQAAVMHCVHFI